MQYKNQNIIKNWQEHKQELATMTSSTPKQVKNKVNLNQLLAIAPTRLFGTGTKKVDGVRKLVPANNKPESMALAMANIMGPSLNTMPEFLTTFYPTVLQRPDYQQATDGATKNLTNLTTAKLRSSNKYIRELFVPINKDDPKRDQKRVMVEVARAVNVCLINHITGRKLTVEDGSGVILTHTEIKANLSAPVSDALVTNALALMRVAGYVELASPEQLTDAGKNFVLRGMDSGQGARVYLVKDFRTADWQTVVEQFNFNLSAKLSAYTVMQLFGEEVYKKHFYDIRTGAGPATISYLRDYKIYKPLEEAAGDVAKREGVSVQTAYRYIDQVLMLKGMWLKKVTVKQALKEHYNRDLMNTATPQAKYIVPVRNDGYEEVEA